MAQIISTPWKNTCGTLPAQLQQWHPCEWQDEDGSQAKQIYHCMMVGIEIDRCATGHEMSDQQSEILRHVYKTTFFSAVGTFASGKTRMAPKPGKSNTACWLASNSTNMPLAMKCQINNGGYLQLRRFTFFALHDLYSGPF